MKIERMCIFPHSVEMFFFTLGGNFFSTLGGNGSNFCQEVSVRPQKVQELHSPDHSNLTFHLWDSNSNNFVRFLFIQRRYFQTHTNNISARSWVKYEIENGFATFRLYNMDIFGAKVLFILFGIGILGTQNEGRIVS